MNIIFKDKQIFEAEELHDLFLSVEWSSGRYSDKLVKAMKYSGSVFTVWDEDKLIGLISVMDDNTMNAYVHYLLVNPHYQGIGIGKQLIEMMKNKYKDYLRIILISYDKEVSFYKNCGFEPGEDKTAMFITSLWT